MNTLPSDTQLKQALAKMLPDLLYIIDDETIIWLNCDDGNGNTRQLLDTELLYLCRLVFKSLDDKQQYEYIMRLWCANGNTEWTWEEVKDMCIDLSWVSLQEQENATWQQRTIALAKVKGLEIV